MRFRGNMMCVLLVALVVWPASGQAGVSNCDRPACLRKCDAECARNVDAKAVAACRASCHDGSTCSKETSCENYLGYRSFERNPDLLICFTIGVGRF